MATLASDQLKWTADQLVHHSGYPTAVLAGILPDPRHLTDGGYHVSIDDLYAHGNGNDYSNIRPNDRGYNPRYGAAIDLGLGKADMMRAFGRIHAVWADHADPRRRFFNAINAWDGSGDATRLNFDLNTAEYASPDHRTHTHSEFHRRFVLDQQAARALVSIYQGESRAAWIAREDPPKPPVEVTMLPITGELPELKKGMHDPINRWSMIVRLQRMLGITTDGDYGKATAAAVAGYDLTNLKRKTDGTAVDAPFWKHLYGITGN